MGKRTDKQSSPNLRTRVSAFLSLILLSLSSVADDAQFHEGHQLIRAKQYQQAITVLTPLAAQGDGEAMYQVGVRALGWKQLVPFYNAYTGIEWMKKAINHGYPKAVAELYYMHEKLWGDESERIAWLRIAAGKGDPWAQTMMGSLASSSEERLNWMRKAAAQNYSEGIFALAYTYELGQDVEQEFTKAAFYYCTLTRHSGARDACRDMGKKLSAQEREQVSEQVKDWLEHNTVYYFTDPLFD